MFIRKIFAIMALLTITACDKKETKENYDGLVDNGGDQFESGDYATALGSFKDAIAKDSTLAEAYSGAGWCEIQLDNLDNAAQTFARGITKTDVPADLNAGYGFVLSASGDYTACITQAEQALQKDPNWTFTYGLGLNKDDLRLMKAQSYYLLGQYASALNEVHTWNASFTADVSTQAGIIALGNEIENRKKLARYGDL